ncbi:UvrD-helicase domain-containing protein [Anaerofilum sp. BX8]|uniref:DNA 3'-5' helicase n=1 Tax=Anaerofilum hominis TaxID=2763016 RepID=A0A923I9M1_9FIRM|nr:UvrD-helicase domain-containing protein [Anaerofilum hominis]
MPEWTREQEIAIKDSGGALLVSASAGSGKTAVLVERALRLIAGPDPVDADRLLILTFSNAAAAELRSRLGLKLEERIRAQPADLKLRRQQMLLQRASISTVSAFCMQLLREHFSSLDIPPDFTVADDAAVYELRQSVLAEVLEESYQKPDFAAFASIFGRARSDRQAGEALLAVYDHLRALPFFDRALGQLLALYDHDGPAAESPWGAELLRGAREGAGAALALCGAALRVVDAEPALAAYRPALEGDRACFERVRDLLARGDWDGARALLAGYTPGKLSPVRGFDGPAKQLAQDLRAGVKAQAAAILEDQLLCGEEEFRQDIVAARPLVAALCEAVRLFDERFFAAKLADKVLEFSDFEHLALRLLAGEDGAPTPLAAEVRGRFDAVMVDEYQDTNAIQDLLYHLLAAPDGSDLFFVGDVKQSIYRFRKAMPEIFIEKKDRFAPYDGAHYPASLILEHNFRSSKGVIEGINYFFSQLMSRQVGELDYSGGELLLPGSGAQDTGLPGAELLVVDAAENPAFGEADAVAELIVRMVREGAPVRGGDGALRPCGFGDFCILLRSPRGAAAAFADALAARGVPAHTDLGDGILTLPEVQPMIAALRVLDNPAQDVPLAALMTSPMFDFSSTELARLRAQTPEGSLFGAVSRSAEPKARAFYEKLMTLRSEAAFLPVDAVCEKLLADTGYLLAVQVAEGEGDAGETRRSALLEFVRMAAGYAAAGSGGLSGFLRSVDNALLAKSRPAAGGAKPPAGTVSILSIHRSKGLEYPVCILADTARQFNKKDLYTAPVLRHTLLGVGLCLRGKNGARYPTAPQRAIRQALLREQLSEEMRVLYVALTRARDRLFLTAASKDPARMLGRLAVTLLGAGGLTPQVAAGAGSFADWLCMAALLHPQAEELRAAAGAAQLPLAAAPQGSLSARLVKAPLHPEGEAAGTQPAGRTAAPDPELLEALQRHFAWRYPREALLSVPAKVSVSSLVHAARDEAETPLRRPSFIYSSGLSAAERGTALHAVLQYADFAAARRDLRAELERLVREGRVSEITAAAADRAALQTFFRSPLMERMLSADRLLREYAFFTRIPAGSAAALAGPLAYEPVLVQGVADCVIEKDGELALVDYKTDRNKTPEQLRDLYAPQLALYREALQRRLGLPVGRCSLYAFALGREIEVF